MRYLILIILASAISYSQSVDFELIYEKANYCSGQTIILDADVKSSHSYIIYYWKLPSGQTIEMKSIGLQNAQKSHTGWYVLNIKTPQGTAIDSVYITVHDIKYNIQHASYKYCKFGAQTFSGEFVNTGSEAVTISDMSIRRMGKEYMPKGAIGLINNKLPVTVNPGKKFKFYYELVYFPNVYMQYEPIKLSFFINSPCEDLLTFDFNMYLENTLLANYDQKISAVIGEEREIKFYSYITDKINLDLKIDYPSEYFQIKPASNLIIKDDYFIIRLKDHQVYKGKEIASVKLKLLKSRLEPVNWNVNFYLDSNKCYYVDEGIIEFDFLSPEIILSSSSCVGETLILTGKVNPLYDSVEYHWKAPNQEPFEGKTVTIPNVKKEYNGNWYLTVKHQDTTLATIKKQIGLLPAIYSSPPDASHKICTDETIESEILVKVDEYTSNWVHSATLKNDLFNLEHSPLPFSINKNDPFINKITLKTTQPGNYYDTLIVNTMFCNDQIIPISVTIRDSFPAELWIPDKVIDPGSKTASVPVYLKTEEKEFEYLSYKLYIEYDPEYFLPHPGLITYKENEKHYIIFEKSKNWYGGTAIIAEIVGDFIKPVENDTIFKISDLKIDSKCFSFSFSNGSITYDPVSVEDNIQSNLPVKINDKTSFNVYPNPADEVLNIEIRTKESGSIIMELIDMYGKTILSEKFSNQTTGKSILSKALNLDKISSGAVILKVTTPAGHGSKKIIIK